MSSQLTVEEMLCQCAHAMSGTFTRQDVFACFRRHFPDAHEQTVGTLMQAMTSNVWGTCSIRMRVTTKLTTIRRSGSAHVRQSVRQFLISHRVTSTVVVSSGYNVIPGGVSRRTVPHA